MKYNIYIYQKKKAGSFHKSAALEYIRRLSRYCKISCTDIKKQKEWDKRWQSEPVRVIVVPGWNSIPSEAFSKQLGRWEMQGQGKVAFFIPDLKEQEKWYAGLSEEEEEAPAFDTLNLSDFMLGSGLSEVVLLEQIYRGYRIMHHHPYHK